MMSNEDATREGTVTSDPTVRNRSAVARLGVNSDAHPEAVDVGFYTMPLTDAIEWAAKLYRTNYWETILGPQIIDQDVANKFFDLGVNEGTMEITKIVQRSANFLATSPSLIVDGKMGPATLAQVNAAAPGAMLTAIKRYAEDFYRSWAMRTSQPDRVLTAMLNRVNK